MEVIELGVIVVGLIVLIVGFAIPLIASLEGSTGIISSSANELWDGEANVSHALSFSPITSITSMNTNATSSSYNKTEVPGGTGNQNHSMLTPLRGNSANATLTVFYNLTDGENITVYVNGIYVGVLT